MNLAMVPQLLPAKSVKVSTSTSRFKITLFVALISCINLVALLG